MRHLLLMLALLALTSSARAAPPDWSAVRELEVRLSNFAYSPERIELQSGEPYRLHLVNAASGGHNFDAPEFFAAAQIAAPDQVKIRKGRVEVKGGQTADVRFVAPVAGTYKLRCTHFLHTSFGMTGEIVVR